MNTLKIHEEIPSQLKLAQKIKDSLQNFSKMNKFKEMIKKIKGNPTYVKYSGKWNIYLDGTAYSGQIKSFDEIKHGYGKMIDIFGRYVIGYFLNNKFLKGVVFNIEGGVYEIEEMDVKTQNDYSNITKTRYIYPNGDIYTGMIKNSFPNGIGILELENPKKILNHNLVYKIIKGEFKNGLPHGNCVIEYINTTENEQLLTYIQFNNGKIEKIIKNETSRFIYYHNCTIENSSKHYSLGVSKFDGSVCFFGESSLTEQNGDGYTFSNEYIVHNKKYSDRGNSNKKGLEFHKYTSSGSFLETDWRHDEQIALGKQYMRYSGVMIEAEWALSRNQNRIMEIRKVVTKQGGEYTRKGPEADQFVYMEIKEKMVEKTVNKRFRLIREGNKYFVTINSAFNASIFSQIQICSGKNIKEINKMISYTISGISEGNARLDKEYYTGEFQGEGFKSQYLLNYNFEGKFISDEPTLGNLTSPFLKFNGSLKDYTLDTGEIELYFSKKYFFKGNLKNEGVHGLGYLRFPCGKVISSLWKNGICMKDKHIAIIHGDQKRKLHRYCLVFLDKESEEEFGEFNICDQIYRRKAKMLTSLIYNKCYDLDRIQFDVTSCGNLRIKKIEGTMETLSLTLAPFTEFERISNDSVNGKKIIKRCIYHTKSGVWIKDGEFSTKVHNIEKLTIVNSIRGIKFEVRFENSELKSTGVLTNYKLKESEEQFIKSFLQIKDLTTELEFRYGIFNELQERLIISKITKKWGENEIFQGKAIAYHLNGNISFGDFYHNFLHGKGTRLFSDENMIQKITGEWEADQTKGEVNTFYKNGSYYEGMMKFLERHGKGKLEYENGESYEGEWFAGLKHGYGKYIWPNGDFYEGEYKLNMMWGEGVLEYRNGDKFIGKFWKNDIINDKKVCNQKWQSIEC